MILLLLSIVFPIFAIIIILNFYKATMIFETIFAEILTIIFGSTFSTLTAIATWFFYKEDMIIVSIFTGILLIRGIRIIISGIRGIIKNFNIMTKGEDCYGKIYNIYSLSGSSALNADFLVYISSIQNTKTVSDKIGFNANKYHVGSYVKLKYYNNNIYTEYAINIDEPPLEIKSQLDKTQEANFPKKDTIIIDGIEYVRKDN